MLLRGRRLSRHGGLSGTCEEPAMDTEVTEIAPDVYRLST
ncbi:MAG: hypothetical protein JWR66_854, partial [Modestobacter sp.]|nr:hypothetical protein [Modestobacter sp.]